MDRYFDRDAARGYLIEVADVLERCGVPFFLMQGTALGAYRDGDFTPTERDIDLGAYRDGDFTPTERDIDFGILWEHFAARGPELADRFKGIGYSVETWALPFTRIRTLVLDKPGVHFDLVSMMLWRDKRFTCAPVHPSIPEPYALVHDRLLLESYQPVELFGRKFNTPNPIETYLEREYGTDWRTPREDHVSRTRIYGFVEKEEIPYGLLDA
jgi:hypothetical protein